MNVAEDAPSRSILPYTFFLSYGCTHLSGGVGEWKQAELQQVSRGTTCTRWSAHWLK